MTLGPWTLRRRLGAGGNGQVWLATAEANSEAAVKILTKTKPKAYSRFVGEVTTMENSPVDGMMPILSRHLPTDPELERAWYAMPVAEPLWDARRGAPLEQIIEDFIALSASLAKLHLQGIAHRDLKPSNLLLLNQKAHLADFGLAHYPAMPRNTMSREDIGPRWTIAPEMRRRGKRDPRRADVYSLAKTLWMFLTRTDTAFEGQYHSDGSLGIRDAFPREYVGPIDLLLSQATDHIPLARPTMAGVSASLKAWLAVSRSFDTAAKLEWKDLQLRLFPHGTPRRASWTALADITSVLTLVGSRSNRNHLFFPTGGGLDLDSAVACATENGCIELHHAGTVSILKPRRLSFESFGSKSELDYFRLEASTLQPCGVYPHDPTAVDEEVTDLGGGEYVQRYVWDDGEYNGKPFTSQVRPLTRYFGGAFVIFGKRSLYNKITATYDARHNEMNNSTFRKYIARINADLRKHSAEIKKGGAV